jgi:isopenicillin N synthase-like dioxygenase
VFEEYMDRLSELSTFFTALVAEALGMAPTAFNRFFDENQQHKLKIIKYPEVNSESDDLLARQGVGPHKDSMLSSYLLQVTPQPGLQAQNLDGEWIDAVPMDNTLVVAFGQGLEALTGGVCASTTHRVLSPRKGDGPRYSVPFFQGVSYDARFEEMDVPEELRKMRDSARRKVDDVEFTFRPGRWGHLGEATLANRVKSHPDVGARWVSKDKMSGVDLRLMSVIVPRALGQDSTRTSAATHGQDDSIKELADIPRSF